MALLASARHQSKRTVEQQVAALRPQPDAPSIIRRLPSQPTPNTQPPAADMAKQPCGVAPPVSVHVAAAQTQRAVIVPLAPERFKVQFTVSRDCHDRLRRIQDLMRHTNPTGDPAQIFDRALTLLLAELEKRKLGRTGKPRPSVRARSRSRHIPAEVRRQAWTRDGGRCAFVGTEGRCAATGFLQLHHVLPFTENGPASVENIELRCRAHNAYERQCISQCRMTMS